MVNPSVIEYPPSFPQSLYSVLYVYVNNCKYKNNKGMPRCCKLCRNREIIYKPYCTMDPIIDSLTPPSTSSHSRVSGHKSHGDHISQPIKLSDYRQHPVILQGSSSSLCGNKITSFVIFKRVKYWTGGRSKANIHPFIQGIVAKSGNLTILNG